MAAAGFVEPWKRLALDAISCLSDAVRETSWGQPTFGPSVDEEYEARAKAIEARVVSQ
jgi:hypothetical protein